MYIILWGYIVKAHRVVEFEEIYAADGVWAQLFKKSAGFLGTELIRSHEFPNRYVSIDRWASSRDYETFLTQWKEEYEKLDLRCDELTEEETCLGKFGEGFHKSR